jgi:hypothetical protein
MLYPLAQAIYYVLSVAIIILLLAYLFRAEIARCIGRSHSQMKNAHKEVTKEYHSGIEEEGK